MMKSVSGQSLDAADSYYSSESEYDKNPSLLSELLHRMCSFALLDFRVSPVVVVRSKWLRIPEVFLFFVASLFMAGYFIYNLHIMEHQAVEVGPMVEARDPTTNFWNCSTMNGDCVLSYQHEPPEYCDANATHLPCVFMPLIDVLPDSVKPDPSLMIGMSKVSVKQKSCKASHSCSGWYRDMATRKEVLIRGSENILIKLRADIHTEKFVVNQNGIQSLLRFHDGKIKRLLPLGKTPSIINPVPSFDFFERRYPEVCGNSLGYGDFCSGSTWGDFIALSVLLDAAGANPIDLKKRRTGFVLQLRMSYTNVVDFWHWPIGFKPRLIYEPFLQNYSTDDTVLFQRLRPSQDGSSGTIVEIIKCVFLKSMTIGSHGEWSIEKALTDLAIALTLLKISHSIVNVLAPIVYRATLSLRHVAVLHNVAAVSTTPSCDTLHGLHGDVQMRRKISTHLHTETALVPPHDTGIGFFDRLTTP